MREIRDLCQKAGVPFFFKQWGGVRKSQTGRRLDGKTYDEFPDFAEVQALESEQRLLLLREVEMDTAWGLSDKLQHAIRLREPIPQRAFGRQL